MKSHFEKNWKGQYFIYCCFFWAWDRAVFCACVRVCYLQTLPHMVVACPNGRGMWLVAGQLRAPLSTGHPEHHTSWATLMFAAGSRKHRGGVTDKSRDRWIYSMHDMSACSVCLQSVVRWSNVQKKNYNICSISLWTLKILIFWPGPPLLPHRQDKCFSCVLWKTVQEVVRRVVMQRHHCVNTVGKLTKLALLWTQLDKA